MMIIYILTGITITACSVLIAVSLHRTRKDHYIAMSYRNIDHDLARLDAAIDKMIERKRMQ